MQVIPIVLCGGAGSRLWPVSREHYPKIFIRLQDRQSLLQKALIRGLSLPNVKQAYIVTNKEFFFKVADEIAESLPNLDNISYIVEPVGRNTAAAIATAVLRCLAAFGEEVILLVLTADHLIQDQFAFETAVAKAITLSTANKIVTFGIKPTYAHTGYGYIEARGHKVLRFIEKPPEADAAAYVDSEHFFWNSGMFLGSAKTIIDTMQHHCPDIITAVKTCVSQSSESNYQGMHGIELDKASFTLVPEQSIDYAVMEKTANLLMVPCDMGWRDIGSWYALDELGQSDCQGNLINGEVFLHDVTNCYIQSERLIGAVGLNNLVIVDTPDALLVADKSRTQDVKHIFSQLKKTNHEAHKLHRTVHRPWGTYTILEHSERFKIKRIEVKPGASLSLQMHHHRSEHWVVVNGMAKVTNGEQEFFVRTDQSTYIPAGCQHRLENPGVLMLVMIEVQSGDYLGEDDIVRYQDDYGRA